MQDQAQPESGKPEKTSRSIAQALVALFSLTAALWIGWWPGLTAGTGANETTTAFQDSQNSTASADASSCQKPDLTMPVQDNGSPVSAAIPTASITSTSRMMPADTAGTSAASTTKTSAASTTRTSAASTTQTNPASKAQTTAVKTAQTSADSVADDNESQQVTEASRELFRGIDPDRTAHWQFPLKVEPYTPDQGVFGANRTSTRLHAGIDLYAPEGTEVFAMTDGLVSQIYLFYESLLAIEVENDDGTTIRYTELTPLVKVGDRVDQGQLIARLKSNSGGTCMLHLEIYATAGTGPLTQVNNKNYLYVPLCAKSYMRRSDLVDPGAVYQLTRP